VAAAEYERGKVGVRVMETPSYSEDLCLILGDEEKKERQIW